MKRGTVWVAIALAVLGLAAATATSILHDGLSASATPTRLEVFIARNVRHLSIPARARSSQNPVGASAENLHAARLHFADHCASCHANDGSGDTPVGHGLYPKPPDLRKSDTQDLSDGEIFWIIENGVRFTGMPTFTIHGSNDDSWKLVLFIRHLPQLSVEERLEMQRYNPKGPEDHDEEQQEQDFLKGGSQHEKPHHPQ